MTERDNRYFPHIDGVRALAVLGVLFFHLDWDAFSGGFVGVDVFFVISGYLITSHLLNEMSAGQMHFGAFYLRRIRRLGPALLFTLVATFAVGALFLPPAELEQLSASAIAATLSVSNILFWSQAGYFDTDAISKPLLHTWSLGVEEQFYLFWPLLLFLAVRWGRPRAVMAVAGLLSLIAAQGLLAKAPAAVFFLTPFRMTEFAIGGLLAAALSRNHAGTGGFLTSAVVRELFTLAGFGLVLWAMLTYNERTPFPGLAALAPCLGAAALIVGGQAPWSGWLLRNPLSVGIGKISYSLYLAHWPVIVFFRGWHPGPLAITDQVLLFTISTVIAVLMYRYVEQPFRLPSRHPRHIPTKKLGLAVAGAAGMLILGASHAMYHQGWSWRPIAGKALTAEQIEFEKNHRFDRYRDICTARSWEHCEDISKTQRNTLVLGDSHGIDGINILTTAFPDEYFVLRSIGGCPPLVEKNYGLLSPDHPDRKACIEMNGKTMDPDYLGQFDTIVISVLFGWYKPEHLEAALERIRAAGVKRVLVFGNLMILNQDLPALRARGLDPRAESELVFSFAVYNDELAALAKRWGFIFLPKSELLCASESFSDCPLETPDGALLTYDIHHLSIQAATLIGQRIKARYPDFDAIFDQHTPADLAADEQ